VFSPTSRVSGGVPAVGRRGVTGGVGSLVDAGGGGVD